MFLDAGKYIFYFLVFPGFIFTLAVGLISVWIDRKVTARVQWRVGPPPGQPLYDILKLLGKETIVPKNSNKTLFLSAPLVGLGSVTIVSVILWLASVYKISFVGDLFVVVYLLMLPSLSLMIGGMASGNPMAATGANREMKLILAYELPFLLCLAIVIIKSGISINMVDLAGNHVMGSISGVLAFLISLLCIQAKLGFTPFDIAEAETEIMEGPYIEYSGVPLALFKITQAMLLFTLPVYLISVFLGGLNFRGLGILWTVLKYVAILVVIIVIKNTNPRLRIDQALKFFWRFLTPAGIVALVLAIIGHISGIDWL
ncbi:MAG: hypothetical protein DRP87_04145 [Spirochaetes bacterium]|nr:MAG: hypothetical protein DRP87_04145 [Spirochaetota bacterium]